jgi:membrane-bound ClpP family serine protease
MIALGVILIILGLVFKTVSVLLYIGVALLVIGAVFWLLGSVGRPVAGRRHWY